MDIASVLHQIAQITSTDKVFLMGAAKLNGISSIARKQIMPAMKPVLFAINADFGFCVMSGIFAPEKGQSVL
jgi:hypothetical protein